MRDPSTPFAYDSTPLLKALQALVAVAKSVRWTGQVEGPSRRRAQRAIRSVRSELAELRDNLLTLHSGGIAEAASLPADEPKILLEVTCGALDDALATVDRTIGMLSVEAVSADELVSAIAALGKEIVELMSPRSTSTDTSGGGALAGKRTGAAAEVPASNVHAVLCSKCRTETPHAHLINGDYVCEGCAHALTHLAEPNDEQLPDWVKRSRLGLGPSDSAPGPPVFESEPPPESSSRPIRRPIFDGDGDGMYAHDLVQIFDRLARGHFISDDEWPTEDDDPMSEPER